MPQGYRDTVFRFGSDNFKSTENSDAAVFYIKDGMGTVTLYGRIVASDDTSTDWMPLESWSSGGAYYVDGLPTQIYFDKSGGEETDIVGARLYVNGGAKGSGSGGGGGGLTEFDVNALIAEAIIPLNHVDATSIGHTDGMDLDAYPQFFDYNIPMLKREYYGNGIFRWVLYPDSHENFVTFATGEFPQLVQTQISHHFPAGSSVWLYVSPFKQMISDVVIGTDTLDTYSIEYTVYSDGSWGFASPVPPSQLLPGDLLKVEVTAAPSTFAFNMKAKWLYESPIIT